MDQCSVKKALQVFKATIFTLDLSLASQTAKCNRNHDNAHTLKLLVTENLIYKQNESDPHVEFL